MSATEVEIGVWVDGSQKWVSGVTRRTTCYDLIRALLRAQNLRAADADVMNYIIVERWKKVERPLDHEQRILKVWKSWGDTVHQVRFSLRRGRDESPDADDNPKKKNKQSCDQEWDKNKENDAQLDGSGSQDGAESSCGRSERSRRRHKMRQSRREATACLQRANVQRVPPLQHHRTGLDSPQPLSDESDSRDCGTRKATKQEPRRPPRDDPRYNETMERLMRLVVAQGETIQNQLRRLNQRESQIESYEQQMHLLRVQSLGNDYLLSSYLHDQHHQPQEYLRVQQNSEQTVDANSAPRLTNHRNPLNPTARLQNNPQNNNHAPFSQTNKGLLPGMADTREVHAKPINIVGDPNDLFIHDGGFSKNVPEPLNTMLSTKFTQPFKNNGPFTSSNKDDTISEEKSNDSGVVLGEECLTLVEDRSHLDFEDLNETEVQERLAFFTKMESILSRLLEEEEKIHGLKSTIEVIQTQQKREKTELEFDLKRAAEDHAALVAEVRSNEQQIRVVDTSVVQKKKLIDALLADEVDSDQETKYLQAKLDYILHLPPTAFRLPEEGDDPPPLPPPPVHPSCLVQNLLQSQPPQVVHTAPVPSQHTSPNRGLKPHQQGSKTHTLQNNYTHYRSSSGDNRPSFGAVHRPPSPNILYGNRAPSPSVMMGSSRAPSSVVRWPNRSCSPNRRKPLHPPPYDHHMHQNGDLTSTDSSSVPVLRNAAISVRNASVQSQVNNIKLSNSSNSLKNTLTSVGILPSKSDLRISNNKNVNTIEKHLHQAMPSGKENNSLNQRTDYASTNKQGDENESDIPPPLPLSPPPLLTPTSTSSLASFETSRNQNSRNDTKTPDLTGSEASKRNLLNSIGSRIVSGYSNKTVDDDDNDSATNNSSLGVSSRSSTSSETSISNCSSSVSSGVCVDSYHSSNKIQRINNQISNVTTKPSKLKSSLVQGTNKPVSGDSIHLRTNSLTPNESKKEADSGDSNSDTGLSSLHSSSDEAGYALDTLV